LHEKSNHHKGCIVDSEFPSASLITGKFHDKKRG
jgi:hypothetical protein